MAVDNKSNKNNNKNKNQQGMELITSMTKLIEASNKDEFTYPFTGSNHDTLPWINEVDKYFRINRYVSADIKFSRIITSMHKSYQNRYFTDTDGNEDTWETLKQWVLKEYPPPKSKHEFRWSLKSMNMYRNEDPCVAYSRWKHKKKLIDKAIDTINEGLQAEAKSLYSAEDQEADRNAHYQSIKMAELSWEDQKDSLIGMFVRRNNKPRYHNDGKINHLVIKRLSSKKAEEISSLVLWDKIFNAMKVNLIPPVMVGEPEYEYITYPPNANDDKIYTRDRKSPNPPQTQKTPQNKHNRKKRQLEHPQNGGQPHQKRRKITCLRCYKTGHHKNECWAKYHKNGSILTTPPLKQRPPPTVHKPTCTICKKFNHTTANCRFNKYKNNNNNNNKKNKCFNCGQQGHYSNQCPSKASKSKEGFTQYSSQQSPSKAPEINMMNNPPNIQNTLDSIKQWASNSGMNESVCDSLHSFVDRLLPNHPRK